jgi:hypothetical protein
MRHWQLTSPRPFPSVADNTYMISTIGFNQLINFSSPSRKFLNDCTCVRSTSKTASGLRQARRQTLRRFHDGTLTPSDNLVIPVPGLGINRLADRTDDMERAQIILLYVLRAETTQEADHRGCRIDLPWTNTCPSLGRSIVRGTNG